MTRAELVLKWAKFYASWGAIPLPSYGVKFDANGNYLGCSCRKGANCPTKSQGKHPIVSGWSKITDPQVGVQHVAAALAHDPDINICLATGASGLLVVDLDVKDGIDGLAAFFEMVGDQPFPEDFPYQRSGGGGHHFFLSVPIDPRLGLKAKNFQNGVEFKTAGSLIHVFPSRHRSGNPYKWDPPPSSTLMPPPAPDWVVERCKEATVKGSLTEQTIRISSEELRKLGKRWAQSSGVDRSRNGRALLALAHFDANEPKTTTRLGEIFPDGSRTLFLHLTQALSESYAQVKAECVLESLKPAVEWRQSRGHSTGYADIVKMLRDSQQKAMIARSGWRSDLIYAENGKATVCTSNVFLFLRHHTDWDGVLGWDERRNMPVFLKEPPFDVTDKETPYPRFVQEHDAIAVTVWFAKSQQMAVTKNAVLDALEKAARERHTFDPVKDYYESLTWDGVPRLDTWLIDYAGAPDTQYTRRVGAIHLISAVARTYQPGCKVDHVMIFESAQGFKKSTLICSLLPNESWFTDHLPDLSNKDVFLQLAGKLFIEVGELAAVKRAAKERVKNFLTSRIDTYRTPYGRVTADIPRRSIFWASTNERHYLVDEENRRYWPVPAAYMSQEIIETLIENRDQLWAEVVARYKQGAIWHLTPEEEQLAKAEQAAREDVHDDPWLDDLQQRLTTAVEVTEDGTEVKDAFNAVDDSSRTLRIVNGFLPTTGILKALEIPLERRSNVVASRLRRCMKVLGWRYHRTDWARGYVRDGDSPEPPPPGASGPPTGLMQLAAE